MRVYSEPMTLELFAKRAVREHRRAKRLKWLNRCLVPVCILLTAWFVRTALEANIYEAAAAFGVFGILCLFAWRSR